MADTGRHDAPKHFAPSTQDDETAASRSPQNGTPSTCESRSSRSRSRVTRIVLIAVLVVSLLVAAAGAFYLIRVLGDERRSVESMESTEKPATPKQAGPQKVENPIDFPTLKEKNPDVVAWMYIPACDINLPILQSRDDDLFYLNHDSERNDSSTGAPFIQLANNPALTDPVTVVYGHNAPGQFENLHLFEDQDFLSANSEFYVYVPGHIYTYTIVSAYQYDGRHILNTFDFSNEQTRKDYFGSVQNPDSLVKTVNPDVKLTSDSKLLQFSTCTEQYHVATLRYIVSAVQTADQPTY